MRCPNCKEPLTLLRNESPCDRCAISFPVIHGVWCLLPKDMPAWKRDEAHYHTEFRDDPVEVHQLDRLRNRWAHGLVHDAILALPRGSKILEVGAGIGRDTAVIAEEGMVVTETDISLGALRASQGVTGRAEVAYVAADADALPFQDASFDGAFMIAALHHVPDPSIAIREISRVVRPGGVVAVGIEPNHTWHALVKCFRPMLCRASGTAAHGGSVADEELAGFRKYDLMRLFASAGIRVDRIVPVWFLAGCMHYGLEFLFRTLRLHHRIRTPDWVDRLTLVADRAIFSLPFGDRLAWHWTIIGKKA